MHRHSAVQATVALCWCGWNRRVDITGGLQADYPLSAAGSPREATFATTPKSAARPGRVPTARKNREF